MVLALPTSEREEPGHIQDHKERGSTEEMTACFSTKSVLTIFPGGAHFGYVLGGHKNVRFMKEWLLSLDYLSV